MFNLLVGARLVNLENRKTHIKLMFAYLKSMFRFFRPKPLSPSKLLVGSEIQTRLYKSAGSPEPSLITFVISTSPHGFIMLGSDLKKEKRYMGIG